MWTSPFLTSAASGHVHVFSLLILSYLAFIYLSKLSLLILLLVLLGGYLLITSSFHTFPFQSSLCLCFLRVPYYQGAILSSAGMVRAMGPQGRIQSSPTSQAGTPSHVPPSPAQVQCHEHALWHTGNTFRWWCKCRAQDWALNLLAQYRLDCRL